MATTAASERREAPSFARTLDTWTLAVFAADVERVADFSIGLTRGDEAQNLDFACGQAKGHIMLTIGSAIGVADPDPRLPSDFLDVAEQWLGTQLESYLVSLSKRLLDIGRPSAKLQFSLRLSPSGVSNPMPATKSAELCAAKAQAPGSASTSIWLSSARHSAMLCSASRRWI